MSELDCWVVLYSKHVVQKNKKWQDGYLLRFSNGNLTLLDEQGSEIQKERMHTEKILEVGDRLSTLPGKLVELQEPCLMECIPRGESIQRPVLSEQAQDLKTKVYKVVPTDQQVTAQLRVPVLQCWKARNKSFKSSMSCTAEDARQQMRSSLPASNFLQHDGESLALKVAGSSGGNNNSMTSSGQCFQPCQNIKSVRSDSDILALLGLHSNPEQSGHCRASSSFQSGPEFLGMQSVRSQASPKPRACTSAKATLLQHGHSLIPHGSKSMQHSLPLADKKQQPLPDSFAREHPSLGTQGLPSFQRQLSAERLQMAVCHEEDPSRCSRAVGPCGLAHVIDSSAGPDYKAMSHKFHTFLKGTSSFQMLTSAAATHESNGDADGRGCLEVAEAEQMGGTEAVLQSRIREFDHKEATHEVQVLTHHAQRTARGKQLGIVGYKNPPSCSTHLVNNGAQRAMPCSHLLALPAAGASHLSGRQISIATSFPSTQAYIDTLIQAMAEEVNLRLGEAVQPFIAAMRKLQQQSLNLSSHDVDAASAAQTVPALASSLHHVNSFSSQQLEKICLHSHIPYFSDCTLSCWRRNQQLCTSLPHSLGGNSTRHRGKKGLVHSLGNKRGHDMDAEEDDETEMKAGGLMRMHSKGKKAGRGLEDQGPEMKAAISYYLTVSTARNRLKTFRKHDIWVVSSSSDLHQAATMSAIAPSSDERTVRCKRIGHKTWIAICRSLWHGPDRDGKFEVEFLSPAPVNMFTRSQTVYALKGPDCQTELGIMDSLQAALQGLGQQTKTSTLLGQQTHISTLEAGVCNGDLMRHLAGMMSTVPPPVRHGHEPRGLGHSQGLNSTQPKLIASCFNPSSAAMGHATVQPVNESFTRSSSPWSERQWMGNQTGEDPFVSSLHNSSLPPGHYSDVIACDLPAQADVPAQVDCAVEQNLLPSSKKSGEVPQSTFPVCQEDPSIIQASEGSNLPPDNKAKINLVNNAQTLIQRLVNSFSLNHDQIVVLHHAASWLMSGGRPLSAPQDLKGRDGGSLWDSVQQGLDAEGGGLHVNDAESTDAGPSHEGAAGCRVGAISDDGQEGSASTAVPTWCCRQQSPVCLVHGPFGSGKSTLLVALIMMMTELSSLVSNLHSSSSICSTPLFRILLAAHTNVAVDRVLLGLKEHGFTSFLRLGSLKRIAKPILSHSLYHGEEGGGSKQDSIAMLREMLQEATSEQENMQIGLEISALQKGAERQRRKLLCTVPVVGATCCSLMQTSLMMDGASQFTLVVLDEASQLLEPLSLVPILRSGANFLVAAGDPCQLPPVIASPAHLSAAAAANVTPFTLACDQNKCHKGYGSEHQQQSVGSSSSVPPHFDTLARPLFMRLSQLGFPVHLLKYQYRCHPELSLVPNQHFYSGQLVDGCTSQQRASILGASFNPLVFCNISEGQCLQAAHSKSSSNTQEAKVVASILDKILAFGVRPADVGVICFYKAQVHAIQQELIRLTTTRSSLSVSAAADNPLSITMQHAASTKDDQVLEDPDGNNCSGRINGPARHSKADAQQCLLSSGVQVATVDSFQGAEKEIILLATTITRPNEFVADPHRLNVALTRAKRHLIILGNSSVLRQTSAVYNNLVSRCHQKDSCYFGSAPSLFWTLSKNTETSA
ncbi:hypothetical protein CEUSTIGMA_g9154.t1 [Chlamydomonas eustigma]|uniref:AAA+ ATPase domain-containing protein n=1 Tax=Chlamydomonas eustigma TaxID=1157962 RepID=A0A250XFB6_9CHLO|nr:hypothetical protein CEUSTIGMA_g9154.t1 [Chlamydomonas eustigma]|eukprot:GAX81726.1 hypothetical protein CEUSTIGMA_g9154.t1 [Chlamydomonas eustigma]